MELTNINELHFDESLRTDINIYLIDKDQIIPFCYENNSLVLITKNDLSIFIINKYISLYKNVIFKQVSPTDYKTIYDDILTKKNNDKAIYDVSNNIDTYYLLEDDFNTYDIDVENAPVVRVIDSLILEALKMKVSDIHFIPCVDSILIKYRIDGNLTNKTTLPITLMSELSSRIKVLSNLDITKKYLPQDGKFTYQHETIKVDVRTSIMPTIYGEMITLRLLDNHKELLDYHDLGFNSEVLDKITKLINSKQGLILVTGPTGSGKSTTLHSFLLENAKRNENIITVEDPVEYTINKINQIQVNNESGLTFSVALRNILRQDPNIIMIGEIRDEETASIAVRASLTGHLVYSTLHTNTSFGVINRLTDMGIKPYLLLDSLKGIITQRLVRVLCDKCKIKKNLNEQDIAYLDLKENIEIFEPCGCIYCNNTGYTKRRAIYEVVEFDDDFKELLSKKSQIQKYNKLFIKKGLSSLKDEAIKLLKEGVTSLEEVKNII